MSSYYYNHCCCLFSISLTIFGSFRISFPRDDEIQGVCPVHIYVGLFSVVVDLNVTRHAAVSVVVRSYLGNLSILHANPGPHTSQSSHM